ncbi:coiled-coil domain-containing protein 189 isoform X2 [Latimeria chalumnae]|uniref:coiled-coil domain-containing protein 189 isoform X2 n=1 Tax=Latimeria chalumnae TaxID=7897 RepID=UPI0003C10E49|nr:PREDICTED: coiled-coil domain-containing protein C16orf93 homolog isoform X2 [Latimeria chalumnae]|eukprot:XP_006000927.1 PREDICTED: coiled-coil domain-containing protein C16orf93 homolog isoform X2 [Latimeria chalumnae]
MSGRRVKQPEHHKAKICLCILGGLLGLENYASDPRVEILLDVYFHAVLFAREHGFNQEQTSTLVSIIKRVHGACVETPLGNRDLCFNYFTELLFCHSVRRPPFSIDLFNMDQVTLITDYIVNTYFRHFKLYKYIFTPQVKKDLTFSYVGLPELSEVQEPEEESQILEAPDFQEEIETDAGEENKDPVAELRKYIQSQVGEQIQQLRVSFETRLRASEEELSAKLTAVEGHSSGKKSAASAKGKKK